MTARMAADGRPVSPEDVRALILRAQDRRADVNQARTPLDGIPPGQWSDRDVARWLGWCLLGVLIVVFWIGAAVTGVYCWQHWRAIAPWVMPAVLVTVFLGMCRRQAVARSKGRA